MKQLMKIYEDLGTYTLPEKYNFPKAGKRVDGLYVLDDIPNTDSIGASLYDYEELDGIRAVPMSMFQADPKDNFYAKYDIDRVYELASEIKESGEIKPLIVVIDNEGPYVLEGGHRLSSLWVLKKKEIPALVIIDLESPPQTTNESKDNTKRLAWLIFDYKDFKAVKEKVQELGGKATYQYHNKTYNVDITIPRDQIQALKDWAEDHDIMYN